MVVMATDDNRTRTRTRTPCIQSVGCVTIDSPESGPGRLADSLPFCHSPRFALWSRTKRTLSTVATYLLSRGLTSDASTLLLEIDGLCISDGWVFQMLLTTQQYFHTFSIQQCTVPRIESISH